MKKIKFFSKTITVFLIGFIFLINIPSSISQITPPCGWCHGNGKKIQTQSGPTIVCPHPAGDIACLFPCICDPEQ